MILEFEKGIYELDSKIRELANLANRDKDINISKEIERLKKQHNKLLKEVYTNLTPIQKVQIARHADRPQFSDYIKALIIDFEELSGDRLFADDKAIIGGIGKFMGRSVMIFGHQKGHDTESRVLHNFGMPKPEGYRKAKRLMEFANRFNLPVITMINSSGAHPGIDAEERGQAEAIASCIESSINLRVPVISIVIGEGFSGGAIAIGSANYVIMLEHSVYSVITPEGCASILWRSSDNAHLAAQAQKLTAQDLLKMGIIDEIVSEPIGGAHRDPLETINNVQLAIEKAFLELDKYRNSYTEHRYNKFLSMGQLSV